VDHGKSTLADRFLLRTGAICEREFRAQVLDDMDLERERGITIKSSAVTLNYKRGDTTYKLNLIDTPGHVDFNYEVVRSLRACEGALLLVDAAQGVEAQTVANTYLALECNLEIIPVISKIDLASARPDEVAAEITASLGISTDEVYKVSAKESTGIDEVLNAIIDRIPHPSGNIDAPLRALIFDSKYDDYRGVIVYVRIVDGRVKRGDMIRMMHTGNVFEVQEVGIFCPGMTARGELAVGDVGYLNATIRTVQDIKIGDTVGPGTDEKIEPLPGYRDPLPMVYCGLYPQENNEFGDLRDALQKLALNDSSLVFEPETSQALGMGFRCGFLGLLHMEIVQERLERESHIDLVQTAPNVTYEILLTNGEILRVDSPEKVPTPDKIEEFREPVVRGSIIMPSEYIGPIMQLAEDRRGKYLTTEYLTPTRVILTYELPLAEIIYDFYDKLKSLSRGYATLDYDFVGFKAGDLVKVDILINSKPLDALSIICHREQAERRGRRLALRLRKEIPRHLFEIPIQAALGSRVIARETIKATRKDVTAKCYGGDITRKRKLLEKQKEGKKRMKSVGSVEIPQEAFLSILQERDTEK